MTFQGKQGLIVLDQLRTLDRVRLVKRLGILRGADRPYEEGSLGLGLFICGEVAKAHGGEINATSSESGTAFTVRLPRRVPS